MANHSRLFKVDADRIADIYEKVSALGTNDVGALTTQAALLSATGKQQDALDLLEDAAARFPGSLIVQSTLASVLFVMGRAEEAVARQRQVIAAEPANPFYRYGLGMFLYKTGQEDWGRSEFEFVLRHYLSRNEEIGDFSGQDRSGGMQSAAKQMLELLGP